MLTLFQERSTFLSYESLFSPYFWRFSKVPLDRRQEEHGWLSLPTGAVTIQLGDDNVTIQLARDKDRQLKSILWWIKLNVTSESILDGSHLGKLSACDTDGVGLWWVLARRD